jgi:N-acylglucosamine-6-phosphate 2-epimerase
VIDAGADIVAVDATGRTRPNGLTGPQFVAQLKQQINVPVMADCATFDEAVKAEQAGADLVGTTLAGYTPYTADFPGDGPNWDLLQRMLDTLKSPVVLEGRVATPADAARAMRMGTFAVVVGTVITRPRVMTGKFAEAVNAALSRPV